MLEEKVIDLAAFRVISNTKAPVVMESTPSAEGPSSYQKECVEALERALTAAKAGEYNEVFIIVRDAVSQEVDFWYSETTDLEKLRLIRSADAWLLEV